MGNFKVKVNSEAESKEVQELFFELGASWCFGCHINDNLPHDKSFILHNFGSQLFWAHTYESKNYDDAKEITIAELRVMVNPSLNDQYAEIEQVRQAIKVPDGSDSDHAVDAMAYAFMGFGRDKVRQHRHYFIDVSDVDEIDFYEIALRYNVTDPCIQHILKKCLAVGQRGQKDFHHDLKDIYDTAKRMLAVHGLDS